MTTTLELLKPGAERVIAPPKLAGPEGRPYS
jgi:hypothetical protein